MGYSWQVAKTYVKVKGEWTLFAMQESSGFQ